MRADLVEVIERAYRVEQTPAAWLADVSALVASRIDRGHGVFGYFVDLSDGGFRVSDMQVSESISPKLVSIFPKYDAATDVATKRAIHSYAPCGNNDTLPVRPTRGLLASMAREWSVLGINAIDASLRGCCFSRWEPRAGASPFDATEVEDWGHLAMHLAAGARLTRALAGVAPLVRAEAVLTPMGKVVHADGAARGALARESLHAAVIAAERARTRSGRARAREQLRAWQALVAGRWTVVDHFDTDGRRYVIAQPNEPMPGAVRTLSVRERQVARAVALGHSNKLIAYELGLAPSTIGRLLSRARGKLGARTRTELIRLLSGE